MSKPEFHKTGMTPNQAGECLSAAKGALDALLKLEALSKAIMKQTNDNESGMIHQLAKLGNYHAMEQANLTDSIIEELELGEVK